MLPFVGIASRIFSAAIGADSKQDRRQALSDIIKQHLDPGHLALQRDDRHAIHMDRSLPGENGSHTLGPAADGGGPSWVEYVWNQETTLDESHWSHVHWRFYASGRIAFHGRMHNTSGLLDAGDVQGHRIELRTRDGLLIGAWTAAFFVRTRGAVRNFPATLHDEHPLLIQHFDELAEQQLGHWFYER